jgi:hypothetical protein
VCERERERETERERERERERESYFNSTRELLVGERTNERLAVQPAERNLEFFTWLVLILEEPSDPGMEHR